MLELLSEVDVNNLAIGGILISPLLMFLVEWFKSISENRKFRILLPFIFGFVFSFIVFGFEPMALIAGFFLGAVATGEYKFIKNCV